MSTGQKDSATRAILIGVTVTVISGLLLAFFRGAIFSPDSPSPKETRQEPTSLPLMKIQYQLAGRYVILGPNPGGVWAYKPGGKSIEDQITGTTWK